MDASVTARPRNSLALFAGTSTGRGVHDLCSVNNKLPESVGTNWLALAPSGCHVAEPWLTDFRGSVIYTVPKIDVQMSAIMRVQTTTRLLINDNSGGTSGPSLTAVYAEPNALVQQALGRPPSGAVVVGGVAQRTTNVGLLADGQLYQPAIQRRHPPGEGPSVGRTVILGRTSTTCSTRTRAQRITASVRRKRCDVESAHGDLEPAVRAVQRPV